MTYFKWLTTNTSIKKARIELVWFIIYLAFFIAILIHGIKEPIGLIVLIAPVYMFYSQYRHYVHYKRGIKEIKMKIIKEQDEIISDISWPHPDIINKINEKNSEDMKKWEDGFHGTSKTNN